MVCLLWGGCLLGRQLYWIYYKQRQLEGEGVIGGAWAVVEGWVDVG